MTSKTTRSFWAHFDKLPPKVQQLARAKYKVWTHDPFHPSLHFKEVSPDVWSVRISLDYRAMARRRNDLVAWFWIGNHDEYEKLIGRL